MEEREMIMTMNGVEKRRCSPLKTEEVLLISSSIKNIL
jgi:hypothetical protein